MVRNGYGKHTKYNMASYMDANASTDKHMLKTAFVCVIIAAFIISSMWSVYSVVDIIRTASSDSKTASAPKAPPSVSDSDSDIASSSQTQPSQKPRPKTVLLDPGHGGFDPGTAGTQTGIYESEINLAICFELKDILEERGYAVMMTRTDSNALASGKDDDMSARCAMIARSGADIFISIHQNAFGDSSVAGSEVYYHESQPDSQFLANCIDEALLQIPDAAPSRGVKTYGHMLTKFMRYSVLIECGFLTNQAEEAKLVSPEYQRQFAESIANGIDKFYNTVWEG